MWMEGWIDMAKVIVALANFAKAPIKRHYRTGSCNRHLEKIFLTNINDIQIEDKRNKTTGRR
jgi:hypothetical protein